jgi:hypothetical protein
MFGFQNPIDHISYFLFSHITSQGLIQLEKNTPYGSMIVKFRVFAYSVVSGVYQAQVAV